MHVQRGGRPGDGSPPGRPLLVFAQLSDTHVMDHQSPARVELLDRFADPDLAPVGHDRTVGTYRPQELFTHHVLEAMVQAVNRCPSGPVTGAALDFAIVTGDSTDNAQLNELQAYLSLLNGGWTVPDSGDQDRYEGVANSGDPRCTGTRTATSTTFHAAGMASPLAKVSLTPPAGRFGLPGFRCPGMPSTATMTTNCRALSPCRPSSKPLPPETSSWSRPRLSSTPTTCCSTSWALSSGEGETSLMSPAATANSSSGDTVAVPWQLVVVVAVDGIPGHLKPGSPKRPAGGVKDTFARGEAIPAARKVVGVAVRVPVSAGRRCSRLPR